MKSFPLQVIFQGVDRLSAPLNKIKSQLAKFQTQTSKINDKFNKSMMKSAAIGMAGAAVDDLKNKTLGMFAPVIEEGMQFEQAMSKVNAISNATKQEFDKLENKARELGANTSFSATEAADGMSKLAMAGMKTDAIVGSMETVLNVAKAGKVSIDFAADTMTNIAGAYHFAMNTEKEAMESMNRVGNVLAATATKSNTSIETLAETFKYVAPIAQSAGMSIEDLASMTGLLGDIGINSSQAGTALRAGILRLSKLPKPAAAALGDLGIATMHTTESLKKLSDQGIDTSKMRVGDIRQLPDILEEIRIKTADMGSGQRLSFIAEVFGTEAATSFNELISKANESGKSITNFSAEIKKAAGDNALQTLSDKMGANLATMQGAMESAKKDFFITIYKTLLPALTKLTEIGTKAFRWIGDFAKKNPTLVSAIVAVVGVIGTLAAVIAPILLLVAGMGAGWATLSAMFATASAAFAPVIAAITGVVGAISLPVVAVIAVVGVLIAALWSIYENWDEITQEFTRLWELISNVVAEYVPIITDFFSNLWDDIEIAFWDGVRSLLGIFDSLKTSAWEALTLLADSIMGIFSGMWEKVTGLFSSAVSKITSLVPDFIKKFFSGKTGKIQVEGKQMPTGEKSRGKSAYSSFKAFIGFDNVPKGTKIQTSADKNVNVGMGYSGGRF